MKKLSAAAKSKAKLGILQEIANVLDIEIEALQSVRQHLGPEFEQAVQAIAECTGQIVITGVGKSGIIANKIAARRASGPSGW